MFSWDVVYTNIHTKSKALAELQNRFHQAYVRQGDIIENTQAFSVR